MKNTGRRLRFTDESRNRWHPHPTAVCFLAISPAVAQRRVQARGIDTEDLGHLRVLDAAYRALPEFGSFVVVDGDGGPDEVAAALDRVVSALVRR